MLIGKSIEESIRVKNQGVSKADLKKQLDDDRKLEKRLQEDERVRAQEDLIK